MNRKLGAVNLNIKAEHVFIIIEIYKRVHIRLTYIDPSVNDRPST